MSLVHPLPTLEKWGLYQPPNREKQVAAKRHERCNLSNFSASAQLIWGRIISFIPIGQVCTVFLEHIKIWRRNQTGSEGKQNLSHSMLNLNFCIWTYKIYVFCKRVRTVEGDNKSHLFSDNKQEWCYFCIHTLIIVATRVVQPLLNTHLWFCNGKTYIFKDIFKSQCDRCHCKSHLPISLLNFLICHPFLFTPPRFLWQIISIFLWTI